MHDMYETASTALAEGNYRRAREGYQGILKAGSTDRTVALELACALAGEGNLDEAKAISARVIESDLNLREKARFETAATWIRLRADPAYDPRASLERAIAADQEFLPPRLTLARYFLWRTRDPSAAIALLNKGRPNGATDGLFGLQLAAAELEGRFYSAARLRSIEGWKGGRLRLRFGLLAIISAVASMPGDGAGALALAAVGILLPAIGPAVYLVYTAPFWLALLAIRKLGPRLLAILLVHLGGATLALLVGVIIWSLVS